MRREKLTVVVARLRSRTLATAWQSWREEADWLRRKRLVMETVVARLRQRRASSLHSYYFLKALPKLALVEHRHNDAIGIRRGVKPKRTS